MNLFTLSASIGLNTSQFVQGVNGAVAKGKELGQKLSSIAGNVAHVVGNLVGKAASSYVDLVQTAAHHVSDLQQNMGGAEAVWKSMSGAMIDFAKQADTAMGLSTSDALSYSNKIGGILQGLGFSEQEAASMAMEAMQMAVDLSSVMNMEVGSAVEAIIGMFKGETQMMDNLAISMSESALQAYALEKGIKKSTAKMTEQEKALLRHQMLMERGAYAEGNFANEMDTLSGSMQVLSASWQNLLDGSGSPEEFATALTRYAQVYTENIMEIAPRIAKSLVTVGKNLSQTAREWLDSMGGIGNVVKLALNWTLGQFGAPDVDTIVGQVTDWWTGETGANGYELLKTAITWTLGQFQAPSAENSTDEVESWWTKTALPLVLKSMTWGFGELILPLASDVETSVSDWWTDTAWPAIKDFFAVDFDVGFPSFETIKQKAIDFWDEIKEFIAGLFNVNIGVGFDLFGGGDSSGNFTRTDFVNNLNNGVKSLPGVGASNVAGGALNGVNVTNYIASVPQSPRELADEVRWSLQNIRFST